MLNVNQYEHGQLILNKGKYLFSDILLLALDELKFLATSHSVLIKNETSDNVYLDVDAEMIKRVMVNLITNAIKFSPLDSTIICRSKIDVDMFCFEVIDQGPGVSVNMQAKIFDRYESSKELDVGLKSTGLGLSFCKMVVEAHDGNIGVQSELNKGASFYFKLAYEKNSNSNITPNNVSQSSLRAISTECRQELITFLNVIDSMEIYQLSELEGLISKMEQSDICEVADWLSDLKEAIRTCDEDRYGVLLNQMKNVLEL